MGVADGDEATGAPELPNEVTWLRRDGMVCLRPNFPVSQGTGNVPCGWRVARRSAAAA